MEFLVSTSNKTNLGGCQLILRDIEHAINTRYPRDENIAFLAVSWIHLKSVRVNEAFELVSSRVIVIILTIDVRRSDQRHTVRKTSIARPLELYQRHARG